mmetsp:Transcript_18109/g.21690  ORF Transcript_18109/g.21690 Transcript_18109/m.21690 type:complete len:122 (+) Transcript_18109:202-567(+)
MQSFQMQICAPSCTMNTHIVCIEPASKYLRKLAPSQDSLFIFIAKGSRKYSELLLLSTWRERHVHIRMLNSNYSQSFLDCTCARSDHDPAQDLCGGTNAETLIASHAVSRRKDSTAEQVHP